MSACVCSALGSAICKQNGFPARDNAVPIGGRTQRCGPIAERRSVRTNKTLLVLPDRPEELEPNKTPKRETHNNNNSIPSLPLSFFSSPTPNAFFFFVTLGYFAVFRPLGAGKQRPSGFR